MLCCILFSCSLNEKPYTRAKRKSVKSVENAETGREINAVAFAVTFCVCLEKPETEVRRVIATGKSNDKHRIG